MPIKRHAHGRLAAHIKRRGEAHILQGFEALLLHQRIVCHQPAQIHLAQQQVAHAQLLLRRRQLTRFGCDARTHGRDQHIIAAVEFGSRPPLRQHHFTRPQGFHRAQAAAVNHQRPSGRLHFLIARLSAGKLLETQAGFGRFGGHQHQHRTR